MGLGITAYRQLRKLDVVFDATGAPIDPRSRDPIEGCFFQPRVNYDFGPERYAGIENLAVYAFLEKFCFGAGSYGSYGAWREELARMAGYQEIERVPDYAPSRRMGCSAAAWAGLCDGMPFVELVNFSDCDGVIAAETAAKLAADFAKFDEQAKLVGDSFYELFQQWRHAFEVAADGGAVEFH